MTHLQIQIIVAVILIVLIFVIAYLLTIYDAKHEGNTKEKQFNKIRDIIEKNKHNDLETLSQSEDKIMNDASHPKQDLFNVINIYQKSKQNDPLDNYFAKLKEEVNRFDDKYVKDN